MGQNNNDEDKLKQPDNELTKELSYLPPPLEIKPPPTPPPPPPPVSNPPQPSNPPVSKPPEQEKPEK